MEEGLKKNNEEEAKKHKYKRHYSPTDAGKCPRQLWYSWMNFPKDEYSSKELSIFAIGNITHDFLEKITPKTLATEFRIDQKWRGLPFAGYVDSIILTEEGIAVVDWKTIKDYGIKYVESEPKLAHQKQLNLYMDILHLDNGYIVYWNKADGTMIEHQVEYNEEIVDEIEEFFKMVEEHVQNKTLPDADYDPSGNWKCRYCKYADFCKKDMNNPTTVNLNSYGGENESE